MSDKLYVILLKIKFIIIDERGRVVICSCLYLMKIFVIDIGKILINIFKEIFIKYYNMKKFL